ncbi:MAG TPA: hypothetical protein VGC36_07060 [Rhizomicrobium sp.]
MDKREESAEEAARLDRLLAQARAPAVPATLERRILADFDRVHARRNWAKALRRVADAVWPGAPLWQPAAVFGFALLMGAGVAAFAPLDIPRQDDASVHVFALDAPPDIDAGQGL